MCDVSSSSYQYPLIAILRHHASPQAHGAERLDHLVLCGPAAVDDAPLEGATARAATPRDDGATVDSDGDAEHKPPPPRIRGPPSGPQT